MSAMIGGEKDDVCVGNGSRNNVSAVKLEFPYRFANFRFRFMRKPRIKPFNEMDGFLNLVLSNFLEGR